MAIRTLIVDDEPLARDRLRRYLAGDAEMEIAGECGDGLTALRMIDELRPDLLFLDVQMPELDGFGLLAALDEVLMPEVVFVTAYDQYALRAFEVHAIDYLLKPFDRDRFRKALGRAKQQLRRRSSAGEMDRRLLTLLAQIKSEPKHLERVVIKSVGRVVFLKTSDIDWIEAEGNYAKLHVGGEAHLLRETMNRLEAKLDPEKYLRIHRSTIVNVERIRELQPLFSGDCAVILRDGTRLTLSRSHRDKLAHLLDRPL